VQVPVYDDPEEDLLAHLPAALAFIRGALEGGRGGSGRDGAVLVHCYAGRSRSAALAAAHLVADRGLSLRQALGTVCAARPGAAPNAGFLAQLAAWAGGAGKGGGVEAGGPDPVPAATRLVLRPPPAHPPLRCRPHPPHRLAVAVAAAATRRAAGGRSWDGGGGGPAAPPPALRPASPWGDEEDEDDCCPSEAGSTPAGVSWAGRGLTGGGPAPPSLRASSPGGGGGGGGSLFFGSSFEGGPGGGGGGGRGRGPPPSPPAARRAVFVAAGALPSTRPPRPTPPPTGEMDEEVQEGEGDDGAMAEGELR